MVFKWWAFLKSSMNINSYIAWYLIFVFSYGLRGGRYTMEFLIDQRKCDLFSVLVSFLQAYESTKDQSGMIVKNFTSLKEGNTITLQIEFEENIGNPKRSNWYR